uniref:Uncharacterized protein n=1 Tax=Romanomermis culicivorax TaxID=13658 RepID=A0A915K8S2_ROMCU
MAAFGMSGLCNLSTNDHAARFILTHCLSLMKRFFDGAQFSDEILLPALTCLISLCEPLKIEEIKTKVDVAALIRLFKNNLQNRRLRNLLFILLIDKIGFDLGDIT